MTPLIAVLLLVVAGLGAGVVLTGDPERQAITLSVFGLGLTLLFAVLMAPDVALSQLTVGSAIVPLMVLLAVRKNRQSGRQAAAASGEGEGKAGRSARRAGDSDRDEGGDLPDDDAGGQR